MELPLPLFPLSAQEHHAPCLKKMSPIVSLNLFLTVYAKLCNYYLRLIQNDSEEKKNA